VISASRAIERSRIGMAFAAIRDDQVAAEATGVPTLRLKLLAIVLSGAFMGMAGAPLSDNSILGFNASMPDSGGQLS
jgi:branched-chain amino acid transport system permease protein